MRVLCLGTSSSAGPSPAQQLHCLSPSTNRLRVSQTPVWAGKHPRCYYYVLLVHSENCALREQRKTQSSSIMGCRCCRALSSGVLHLVPITCLLAEALIRQPCVLSLRKLLEFLLHRAIAFDLHLPPLRNNLSSEFHKCHLIFVSYLNKILAVVFISWQLSNAISPFLPYFTSQQLNLTRRAKSPAVRIQAKIPRHPKNAVLNPSAFSPSLFLFIYRQTTSAQCLWGPSLPQCYTDARTPRRPILGLSCLQKWPSPR